MAFILITIINHSMLEATVISPSIGLLDVKVYDGGLIHRFTIRESGTNYEITMDRGEIVASASADGEVRMTGVGYLL